MPCNTETDKETAVSDVLPPRGPDLSLYEYSRPSGDACQIKLHWWQSPQPHSWRKVTFSTVLIKSMWVYKATPCLQEFNCFFTQQLRSWQHGDRSASSLVCISAPITTSSNRIVPKSAAEKCSKGKTADYRRRAW